ncbi:homocysteine S-methyltransferase family protein [Salinimonas lutimaris]|uniref:homocysteine S-methyltransferase family protein n=1 Tax=Salinimonas lutimaris TaxID=914153 RepID=UPI0010C03E04|nr:homocysteine S-methyltransferase family protein [Salinimonas lutimaris]
MSQFTLLDGGMGRELKASGAPFSRPYWSAQALMEAPQTVLKAHQRFIDAGAEIITVNSYACVPFHLGEDIYQTQGAALTRLAGQLARQAADKASSKVQVAGSLPPPMGSYRPDLFNAEKAIAIYQMLLDEQAPYADLWIAETIASLEELNAVIPVARQSSKPCFYAFTLSDDNSETSTLRSGQSVESAVALAAAAGAAGVLFNCSVPEAMSAALTQAKEALSDDSSTLLLGVYANNFAPIGTEHLANSQEMGIRELTPQQYLAYAKTWYEQGARIIGGCCGIGPEHIDALRQWQQTITPDGQSFA